MSVKKFNRLTTIEELLDWVAEPDLFQERAQRLVEVAEAFPAIKEFIRLSHSRLDEYADLLPIPKQAPASKISNRQELGFQEFFDKNLTLVAPGKPGSLSNKRSKLYQMLDFVEPRDFALIRGALAGEFVYGNDKVNIKLLQFVFPSIFPNA